MKIGIINGWWLCLQSSLFTQLVECQFKRLLSQLGFYSFSSPPCAGSRIVRSLFINSYSEVEHFLCQTKFIPRIKMARRSTSAPIIYMYVMVEQRGVGAFNQALYYPCSLSLPARRQRPHFARLYLERCTANTRRTNFL